MNVLFSERLFRMDTPHLSLVIPAYNESRRLPDTVHRCIAFLENSTPSWDIVVVDDGTRDDTAEVTCSIITGDARCF